MPPCGDVGLPTRACNSSGYRRERRHAVPRPVDSHDRRVLRFGFPPRTESPSAVDQRRYPAVYQTPQPTSHAVGTQTRRGPYEDEAPRSKLRGITELKHSELSEILPRLPLSLYIPFHRLPIRTFAHRRHIVPICPKFPTPQHPFDGRLSPKDLSRRNTLEHLHNPPRSHLRMGTAEHMDMILVRANCFHLNRKPLRNLCRRFLDNPRHFLIQQRLAVFHRKHNVVMDLPCTVCPFSDLLVSRVSHVPEGTREEDPRSKLRGITS